MLIFCSVTVKTVYFSESSVLPPISITMYFDPGRAKTSDIVASPFSLANFLIFISLQYIEAASGSKAISSYSGVVFDIISAFHSRGKKRQLLKTKSFVKTTLINLKLKFLAFC